MKIWEIRALVADCEAATIRATEALRTLIGKRVVVWPGCDYSWTGTVKTFSMPVSDEVAVVADEPESLTVKYDRDKHARDGWLLVGVRYFKLAE